MPSTIGSSLQLRFLPLLFLGLVLSLSLLFPPTAKASHDLVTYTIMSDVGRKDGTRSFISSFKALLPGIVGLDLSTLEVTTLDDVDIRNNVDDLIVTKANFGYRTTGDDDNDIAIQLNVPTAITVPSMLTVTVKFKVVTADPVAANSQYVVNIIYNLAGRAMNIQEASDRTGVPILPIANAGSSAQTVNPGDLVTLTAAGSSSTNPAGMPLTYLWTQRAGTLTIMLSSTGDTTTTTVETPTFTAPDVDEDTVVEFALVVLEGITRSEPSRVRITVEPTPEPVASPGTPALAAGFDTGSSSTDRITNRNRPTLDISGTIGDATMIITATQAGVDDVVTNSLVPRSGGIAGFGLLPLSDGVWEITAIQRVGRGSSPPSGTLTITVDTVLPTITITTQPNPIPTTSQTVAASFSDSSSGIFVDASVDTPGYQVVGSSDSCASSIGGDGFLSYGTDGSELTFSELGVANNQFICFRAEDNAGNVGYKASNRILLLTPRVMGTPTLSVASDSGARGDNITNAQNITVSVTGVDNEALSVTFTATQGSITKTETATPSGRGSGRMASATFSGNNALGEGVWSITAKQTIGGRDGAESPPLSITIDRVRPIATISSTETDPTNADTIPITVVFDKAVTGFTIGDVAVTGGRKSGLFTSSSGDTTYTFSITTSDNTEVSIAVNIGENVAEDTVGNGNAAATFSILSDKLAPMAPTITQPPSPTMESDIRISGMAMGAGTGSNSDASSVDLFRNGVRVANGLSVSGRAWTAGSISLDEGTNTFTAVAFDSGPLFNRSGTSTAVVVIRDITAPVITLNRPAAIQVTLDQEYVESVTATDNIDGTLTDNITATITITENGAPVTVSSVNTSILDAAYTIVYTLSDAAGNLAMPKTRTVTIALLALNTLALSDSTNSGSTTDNITNAQNIIVSVSGVNSAATRVTFTATKEGSTTETETDSLPSNGVASVTFSDLTDGDWSITAVETVGGTDGVVSDPLVVTIDRTNPAAPTPTLTDDTGTTAGITTNAEVTVSGLETETGATWAYKIGTGSFVTRATPSGGTATITASEFGTTTGVKTVFVRQTDVATNLSSEGSLTFTLVVEPMIAFAIDSLGRVAMDDDGGVIGCTSSSYTSTGLSFYAPVPPVDTCENYILDENRQGVGEITTALDGTTVAEIVIVDANDGALFELVGSGSSRILQFKTANIPDFENPPDRDQRYWVRVMVTDSEGYTATTQIRINIQNVDETVSVSSTTRTLSEGSSYTYNVVLDGQPVSDVTVEVTSGDTALATVSPSSLVFTPRNWDTAQTVTVNSIQNGIDEDNEVTISHSIASGSSMGFVTTPPNVVVTITDDDTKGVIVTRMTVSMGEGLMDTYGIVLTSEPTGDVTITPSTGDSSIATVSTANSANTLVFTPMNWDETQTVTITGVDDGSAAVASRMTMITHTISGGDYNSVSVSDVNVTVVDEGSVGVTIDSDPATANDSGDTVMETTLRYTVTFNSAVTGFTASDIIATGTAGITTVSNLQGSGADYTFNVVRGDSDGTVGVSIPIDGVLTVADSKPNIASNLYILTIDTVTPAPIITALTARVNTNTITITGTAETGATVTLTPSGLTSGAITASSSGSVTGTWTITDVPLNEGVNTFTAIATDAAGNISDVSNRVTVMLDTVMPTVTISSTESSPTNTNTIPITVTFSKPVTGFDIDDITISSGSKSGFSSVGSNALSTDYTFNLIPAGDSTITVTIAANVAMDAASNGNTAATFSIISDRTKPVIAVSGGATVTTAVGTLYFDERATASDAIAGNLTSRIVTTVVGDEDVIAATAMGTYTITYTVSDDAGNDAITQNRTVTVVQGLPSFTVRSEVTFVSAEAITPIIITTTSDGTLTYTISPNLPETGATLTFSVTEGGRSAVISGTATTATAMISVEYTITATNSAGTIAEEITITTVPRVSGGMPIDGDGNMIADATTEKATDNVMSGTQTFTIKIDDEDVTFSPRTITVTITTGAEDDADEKAIAILAVKPVSEEDLNELASVADQETQIDLSAVTGVDETTKPALAVNTVVDIEVNASACTQAVPCEITLSYEPEDVSDGGQLYVFHYDESRKMWEALPLVSRGSTDGQLSVTASVYEFSPFALFSVQTGGGGSKTLNAAILTRLMQVAVANVASSVESRADAVFSDAPQGAIYQLNGQTVQLDDQSRLSTNLQDTLQRQLPAYIKSLQGDGMDWKQMVSDSSFVLPLNATDNGGAGDSELTIWGSGDYTKLGNKGAKETNLDWEGDVFGIQLGVDNRVRDDLLFGGLVSWSKGDVNYTRNDEKGDYTHTLTSVHPYMAWSNGGINLWGNVGFGQGKLEIDQTGSDKRIHDTHLLSLTAGAKGRLPQTSGVSLKSDITLLQIRIDAETLSSQQFRLILESEQQYALASGGTVTPALEIGARYDVGDGDTGFGMVLGAGLRYANTTGLTVEGKINTLLGRKNYKEWGISGTISQRARADGRGFAFSLSPSYGDTGSNTNQAWQGISEGNSERDYSMRVNTRLGYGLSAPGGRGLLTPYSEITIGDTQNYRLGITWKRDSLFDIHLSGEREESSSGTNNNRVLLESTIRF